MSLQPNQIDQNQLISGLQAKQVASFEELYRNYSGAVYGIIYRIIPDEDVAKEVLQDAFLKIWNKIDQYDATKGRLFTWMANISRNLAIDKLRSKEMKKVGKTDNIETYVSLAETDDDLGKKEDSIGLRDALSSLREEERFILEMAYFKGYTQSEIAEEFGIPLGTVKTRLRMGMVSLRKVLKVA